ncbi:MAG: AbrB/MazE/SpoVT family DNA-binding domain-containing protein [Thaumarchaeota archaeon]|nr:AbrB/MazE/SpoVT family DNA-binding domain-containing protein [Nitrososphaerota archaeon]
MLLIRKIIQKNERSWGVSIPAEIVRELGWKKHTYVYIHRTKNGFPILRAVPEISAADKRPATDR